MKIKSTNLLEENSLLIGEPNGSNPIEEDQIEDNLEEGQNEDSQEEDLEENPFADVEIEEVTTPAGSKAIKFISPISNKEVIVLNPSNRRLSAIAQEVSRRNAHGDAIMQMCLFLRHLICKYDKKEGEKCLSLNYLLDDVDPRECRVISLIINQFFRLD